MSGMIAKTPAYVSSGYKQTDLGLLPTEWDVVDLNSIIAEISMGPFGSDITVSNFVSSGIPVLNGNSVSQERLKDDFENFVTARKAKSLKKAVARRGDVVVTHRGTIGQIAYIPDTSEFDEYVISQSQFRVRVSREVLPSWVVSYFHSENGSRRLLDQKGHTGVPAIAQATSTFRRLKIPVPPLAEQKVIRQALLDADALIESLEVLIGKKRAIQQGAMQDLFSGRRRLPGFSEKWVVKTLGELGPFFKGSGVRKDEAQSGTLPCVRYGEIYTAHNDIVRVFQSSISREVAATALEIRPGDILFAGSGETKEEIGKSVAIVGDKKAYAGGDIVVLRPTECDPYYLGYALNHHDIQTQKAAKGQGDAVVHISANALASISIKLPRLDEQVAIGEILNQMDDEIAQIDRKLDKARLIKQGMMQELLTGRVRLV